jgi:motility quorum-sensing regulator/GCU-specific mRNA interferase toxin
MEKRRPTYDLDAIKAAIGSAETLAIARSAFSDALSLEFNRAGIGELVQSLQRSMFYNSMTTYTDYRTWQDVYHVPADGLLLYLKFQADVVTEFRVMSFEDGCHRLRCVSNATNAPKPPEMIFCSMENSEARLGVCGAYTASPAATRGRSPCATSGRRGLSICPATTQRGTANRCMSVPIWRRPTTLCGY